MHYNLPGQGSGTENVRIVITLGKICTRLLQIQRKVDGGDWLVTTNAENLQLIAILLRYLSKKTALKMLVDMEKEVGDTTDNISLRDSIKMARCSLG